jgi:hypothetical protein
MMNPVPNISIEAEKGLKIETPMLRIPETATLYWRLRADQFGTHNITVKTPGHPIKKRIIVANALLSRISLISTNPDILKIITTPGVERIFNDSFVAEIRVRYPPRRIEIMGRKIHWLLVFFILTLAFAFILRRPLKVHI